MSTTARKRAPRDLASAASGNLARSRGDTVRTLHEAIQDTVWKHEAAQDQQQQRTERAVSRGYVRGGSFTRQ